MALDSLGLHSARQKLKKKQKKESRERKEINFWRELECYSLIAVEIAPCFLVQTAFPPVIIRRPSIDRKCRSDGKSSRSFHPSDQQTNESVRST